MIVSHQRWLKMFRKRRLVWTGPRALVFSSLCQAYIVEAILFTMVNSEAFVVLVRTSTTLLQGSSMAGTTLTVYVGLTPSDAQKIFKERQAVEPHWRQRWGLKSTALEARTRLVCLCHNFTWAAMSILSLDFKRIHLSQKCRPSSAAATRISKEVTSRISALTRLLSLRMASAIWLYFDSKEICSK